MLWQIKKKLSINEQYFTMSDPYSGPTCNPLYRRATNTYPLFCFWIVRLLITNIDVLPFKLPYNYSVMDHPKSIFTCCTTYKFIVILRNIIYT